MDHRVVLKQLDEERRGLRRDWRTLEILPEVTRLRIGDPGQYMVSFSALTAGNADEIIAREIEHHSKLGVCFEWKVYAHDQPADLLERLKRRGFAIGACEAVMVFELGASAEWMDALEKFKIVRIESLEHVAIYRRLATTIFQRDEGFIENELAVAVTNKSTQHRGYLAYAEDEAVSVGRLYTHPRSAFAGLYGGGTLPEFRGKGIYRALIAARARDAVAAGAKYLLVDALPTSRPILERLGFECVTRTWPCEWQPGNGLPDAALRL